MGKFFHFASHIFECCLKRLLLGHHVTYFMWHRLKDLMIFFYTY
jgi:hypothetical protein